MPKQTPRTFPGFYETRKRSRVEAAGQECPAWEGTLSELRANRLAIEGGLPLRSEPLPWEFPGANWIGAEERALIDRVVAARSPFRYYGPDLQGLVAQAEGDWCAAFGHRHALAVASATAGLSVALSALGLGPGDEVLLPGCLWVSCLSAIVRCGAIPRLVDIDASFGLDPADLKRKIGPRSRAVLAVHMSGGACRIEEIAAICRAEGLALVEDCAQAAGASVSGRAVGRFGDIGVFSFQLNKTMTTGEGGLLVCEDPALYDRLVALHDLGYARDGDGRLMTEREGCQLWGLGARMSELSGALLVAQIAKLPRIVQALRRAKQTLLEALVDLPGLAFRRHPDPAGDSGAAMILLFPDGETAGRFAEALRAEGIAGPPGSLLCSPLQDWGLHWYDKIPSLTERRSNSRDGFPWSHPANAFAADYTYGAGTLPVCDALRDRGMILQIGSTWSAADLDDVVAAFRKVARVLLA
ncbi:MAG: DegT/DnrJ/EryC1/StrS family aminotransferase [Rhodospirillales bacterium]